MFRNLDIVGDSFMMVFVEGQQQERVVSFD
jgi:hypothetical protein